MHGCSENERRLDNPIPYFLLSLSLSLHLSRSVSCQRNDEILRGVSGELLYARPPLERVHSSSHSVVFAGAPLHPQFEYNYMLYNEPRGRRKPRPGPSCIVPHRTSPVIVARILATVETAHSKEQDGYILTIRERKGEWENWLPT